MKVSIVYVCPVARFGEEHFSLTCRFVSSVLQHQPLHEHDLVVVSNGGPPDGQTRALFCPLNARFIEHDGSGKDIGAYQLAASQCASDLMVFFGGSAFVMGLGWLRRMVDAFYKHGNALYGATANSGDVPKAWPHIRTTGFWCPPDLMNRYPVRVTKEEQRYPFEHGPNCLTQWVINQGLKAWMVLWKSEHDTDWHLIPNSFHRGDQSAVIVGDRLTTPPHYYG